MYEIEPDHGKHQIKIDWTVNLTTLFSIAIALATGAWTVASIQAQNDKRLALLEAAQQQQHVVDSTQDQNVANQIQLIRASQTRIESKLDRLIENEAARHEGRP